MFITSILTLTSKRRRRALGSCPVAQALPHDGRGAAGSGAVPAGRDTVYIFVTNRGGGWEDRQRRWRCACYRERVKRCDLRWIMTLHAKTILIYSVSAPWGRSSTP